MIMIMCSAMGQAQDWQPTYEQALNEAKTKEKPLVLVFSGSDWCGPCKKLDQQVWQTQEFRNYAKDHYILYRADFPRKKKNQLSKDIVASNAKLAEKFNQNGYFPLVLMLNENQKVLGSFGYKNLTPEKYIALLNTSL